jgi:hypothetical protein
LCFNPIRIKIFQKGRERYYLLLLLGVVGLTLFYQQVSAEGYTEEKKYLATGRI